MPGGGTPAGDYLLACGLVFFASFFKKAAVSFFKSSKGVLVRSIVLVFPLGAIISNKGIVLFWLVL